jgi:hypothetical protein
LFEYPFVSHHVARFFAERAMLTPLLQAVATGDGAQLQMLTRKMVWTAAPGYIPGRISWFFGKVVSKTGRTLRAYFHKGK